MSNAKILEEKNWSVSDFNYAVPEHAKRFGYTIGGITVVGFILLAITGIILALFFTPSVEDARQSVLNLISNPWGMWLRSFHRWLAEAVAFLVILHITRIIFTGSYAGKRKWNWLFGIGLLVITYTFLFTGTAIKWDQEGYEAFQHAIESMELVPLGRFIAEFLNNAHAVMRLFTTHVLILPVLLLIFLIPHLVLMKLNGLSPIPRKTLSGTITFYNHVNKIIIFSIVIYSFIAFLAAQFPMVLYPGPYSGVEITKPPWVFLPLYQLEDWFGVGALVVFPVLVLIGLVLLPFIDKNIDNRKIHNVVVWSYLILITIMILFIIFVAITPPVKHLEM